MPSTTTTKPDDGVDTARGYFVYGVVLAEDGRVPDGGSGGGGAPRAKVGRGAGAARSTSTAPPAAGRT